jgi:hypothetical protein
MPSFLRSIAVTVDETDPGTFYWVLLESHPPDDEFRFLASAPRGTDSYERALQEGVAALMRLCQARDKGPRREAPQEHANPSGWLPLV